MVFCPDFLEVDIRKKGEIQEITFKYEDVFINIFPHTPPSITP